MKEGEPVHYSAKDGFGKRQKEVAQKRRYYNQKECRRNIVNWLHFILVVNPVNDLSSFSVRSLVQNGKNEPVLRRHPVQMHHETGSVAGSW